MPAEGNLGSTEENHSSSTRARMPLTCSSKKLRTIMKEILDPWGPYVPMWSTIFAMLSVIAVTTDPLFLYVPVLDEKNKCIGMDRQLKIIALVLRTVTDVSYAMHIIFQICATYMEEASFISKRSELVKHNWEIAKRIRWSYILIDIFAILPLPQVLILIYFSKVRGSRSLTTSKFINFLVLIQYVPRILRINLSLKELKRTPRAASRTVWLNGVLNLFLYIVASHVLGAVWYFFSIQRETACWHHACKKHTGCVPGCFDCGTNTSTDLSFLSNYCPTNSPKAKDFDYGIFSDAIQSGILKKTGFLKKFVRCFWWGLRNVSSFGQNLQTSTDILETCFAATVSVIALLLFIYLIGNLQMYFQMAMARSEEIQQKMRMFEQEIDFWILRHGFPANEKMMIIEEVRVALEHDKESFDLEKLRSLLMDCIERTKRNFSDDGIENLRDGLRSEDRAQLVNMIKEQKAEKWMVRNGIPDDMKLDIMPYVRSKLRDNESVDLKMMLSILPLQLKTSVKKHLCLHVLKRMPTLQDLSENDVEVICDYLKPVVYPENSYIIQQGEPLDLIFFITDGIAWKYTTNSFEQNFIASSSHLEKGDFYGNEELLEWASNSNSLSNIPISTINVKVHNKVEALALTARDLRNLVFTPSGSSSTGAPTIQIKVE